MTHPATPIDAGPRPTASQATADGNGEGGLPHRLQTHIAPLDGLRGWAAFMVVLSHMHHEWGLSVVSTQLGDYGVLLFFILSGFLMGHLYLRKRFDAASVQTYFAARVSRIVPLYYLVLVLGFLAGWMVDPGFTYAMPVTMLGRHLLFAGTVPIFWSIGPEFQFYFLFPLLWWLFSLTPERAMRHAAWIVPVVLAIVLLRASFSGILVFSKLHIFLVGVAIALLRPRLAQTAPSAWLIAQLLSFAFLIVLLLPADLLGPTLYPAVVGDPKHSIYYGDFGKLLPLAFCILAFSVETPFALRLFANPLARALGKYSFSVYLLHTPLLYGLRRAGLLDAVGPAAAMPIALAIIFAVSALSFRLFEEPSRVATRGALLRLFAQVYPAGSPRGQFGT